MSTNNFGVKSRDYIPYHESFNYRKETLKSHHLAPSNDKYPNNILNMFFSKKQKTSKLMSNPKSGLVVDNSK